jgi:RimJ/RimL family protein N-acetyltransferase
MTLAHGTDRLESARLVLRRIAPDDLPFFTRIHALPEVAQYLYPGGRPRSPEESAAWLRATLGGAVAAAPPEARAGPADGDPARAGRAAVGGLGW